MKIDGYEFAPLNPARWDDFETVLGKGGISGCWCMYWLTDRGETFNRGTVGGSKGANKSAFRDIVEKKPPGLLAYRDSTPVAWVRVMARSRHPGLARSRFFKTDEDTQGIWSLSCFVIRRQWRGQGLTEVLIHAAIRFARKGGAKVLEAYPTDTDVRLPASSIYMGRATTFRRLGFVECQRKAPHKPMMRLTL